MTAVRTAPYEVHRASPVLGAEIVGVDLNDELDDETAERLRDDFREHKVLVFRDQHLSPDAHVRAVSIFDEPFDHPLWRYRHPDNRLVYVFDLDKAGGAATWHVGGTWRNPPFNIESLTYQVVPEVGGRTLWADLQAAYDGLSEPVKELLESVSAVYSAYPGDGTYDRPPVTETVEHPVVVAHRDTGRKGLFISSSAHPPHRHRAGRRRRTAAVPADPCLLPQLQRRVRMEAGRLRHLGQPGDLALRRQRLRRSPRLPQGHRRMSAWAETDVEPLADLRARRRREVAGPRGPVSFFWGDFVTEVDQHVDGAPGRWSPRDAGLPGLLVRAGVEEGIRIGGAVVDGEAILHADEADGPTVAEFPDGAEGIIFTYDGSKYALQVWNQASPWAQRFHDIAAFDEDPTWIVRATVTPAEPGRTVSIIHHRDPVPVDVPVVATLQFERDDVTHQLVATAAGPSRDRLLVHFRDTTSGNESYGAGRSLWIDVHDVLDGSGETVLDFNRAALLPCSFSTAWNCPIPPEENTLTIPVRAGERHAVDRDGVPLL